MESASAAGGGGGRSSSSSGPGWGPPCAPGQRLLRPWVPSLPRAGLLVNGRPPAYPAGLFRRAWERWGVLDPLPRDPSLVADLEELVRKLHVSAAEEEEGEPRRDEPAAPSAGEGSGESPRGAPMEADVQKQRRRRRHEFKDTFGRSRDRFRELQNSIRLEEQTRAFQKVLKIWGWDEYLLHAGQCSKEYCMQPSCKAINLLVQHIQACGYSSLDGCEYCNYLVALCYAHAQQCTEDRCPAPFCLIIRPHLPKVRLELLPNRVKNGKMVAMSMVRARRLARSASADWQTDLDLRKPRCANKLEVPGMLPGPVGECLRLPGVEPLTCIIPTDVLSFLRRIMRAFRIPERKVPDVSARL